MVYFLEQVARQLYDSYTESLNRHCLVFPNRRAGLFFMKYLAGRAGKPLWAPRIITINELFKECSGLQAASNERLVFEMYKIYRGLTGSEEAFDNFYFWGEMLLGDFDEIDKYLVDAEALFTNISDLHHIDEKFGGLTDEQMAIIRQFIQNFRAGSESDQKRDFEFTWSVLWPLYRSFGENLRKQGIAYEGMIFREVFSALGRERPSILTAYDHYHFIGFNALNKCEKRLMHFLKSEGLSSFYWDYRDSLFYRQDPGSSVFIESNISEFGQSLDFSCSESEQEQSVSVADAPKISIIDIPSDAGQAKLLPSLLREMLSASEAEEHHRTAIILADESLLPSVISSIPPEIRDINITMGYPFGMTSVYALLRALLDIQDRPYRYGGSWLIDHRKVIPVLTNPLIARIAGEEASASAAMLTERNLTLVPVSFFEEDTFLASLFRIADDAASLLAYLHDALLKIASDLDLRRKKDDEDAPRDPLTPEFLFRAGNVLNRLEPLLNDPSVLITREMFIRLADRIFREIKVPFRGEPLKGLQVMGLLESRALDFDNIVMLSSNEGVLPKSSHGSSYIPYSLREAFGLPTITHSDSIYSYYFTRLMTRVSSICFIYNSSAEGLRTGEMSRFLLRFKYSGIYSPDFRSAFLRMSQRSGVPEIHVRTTADIETLERMYLSGEASNDLSPSAINTWLNCRMKFYYSYVCRIREPDRITTGIDPARFGTILHEVVSRIYQPYKNQIVTPDIIKQLKRSHNSGSQVINEVLDQFWYGGTRTPVTGTGLITADIAAMFLMRVLDIDLKLSPFTIVELEEAFSTELEIGYGGGTRKLSLGGKIDRIDEREGIRRLIDYKTGKAELCVVRLEDLFDTESGKTNDAVVQTMIYCVVMSGKPGYERQRPVIYGLRGTGSEGFDDRITVEGEPLTVFCTVGERFRDLLASTVAEIFDVEIPFTMTAARDRCRYCPYNRLCQR